MVRRWDHEPEAWDGVLTRHGSRDLRVRLLSASPGPRTIGTLLVRAVA